jgi:hypothetical protein
MCVGTMSFIWYHLYLAVHVRKRFTIDDGLAAFLTDGRARSFFMGCVNVLTNEVYTNRKDIYHDH